MMRRNVWMEVETCVDCWMSEESILIFIHTPAITISLVTKPSTRNRPILLAVIILPLTVALSVPYLLLFCLYNTPISSNLVGIDTQVNGTLQKAPPKFVS